MRPLVPCLALFALGCQEIRFRADDGGSNGGDPPDVDSPRPEDENPPVAVCGTDPVDEVKVGQTVDLLGDSSYDPDQLPILSWYWELVRRPEGSDARLPRGDANLVGFAPDVLGDYTFTLLVTDEAGKQSNTCDTTISYVSHDGLYVEMLPSAPADGVKLVIAPQDEDPCSLGACDVDWGVGGKTDDDPVYTQVGDGLETLAVRAPAGNVYDIRLYDDPAPANWWKAKNEVTVVVWLRGREAWRGSAVLENEGTTAPMVRVVLPAGTVQDIP